MFASVCSCCEAINDAEEDWTSSEHANISTKELFWIVQWHTETFVRKIKEITTVFENIVIILLKEIKFSILKKTPI